MTNSTDKKSSSFIRTEAVVPVVILLTVATLYVHFLFDSHVRKAVEWTGSYIHGAEVNVSSLKTSFINGTFNLRGLQVTDKIDPKLNLIQIEEIRFGFVWDALLRAKFVVHDSGIDGIQVYSARKKPGYVRPPEPPSNKPSAMAELQNKVLDQTKDEFSGNAVGDLASLLGGTDGDDILKDIQGELKAEATIKTLQTELKAKEKLWKGRIDSLPNKADFDALAVRAKALKFNTKDPKQFAADLKEAGKIAKEADQKIDLVKSTSTDLKGDIDKYKTEFNQIDDLIKQDIKDLEARLKVPNLDMKDLSKNIFGNMFADKLVSVQKYMELGRKYMPPPKDPNSPKDKELLPPPRGAGKSYSFPITTGYPLFWLKRATISSTANQGGFSGNVKGELTNVTSNPKAVGKPAILDVKGDFPNSKIFNTELKVIVDHVNTPTESLELSIGSFPLTDIELIKSKRLGLKLKSTTGSSNFNVKLQSSDLFIQLKNEFNSVVYDLIAPSKNVNEAVSTVLAGVPLITLNAGATGTWSKINFSLNSNLGSELSAGFSKYLQVKIDEKRKQIQALVNSRIKGEKDKLSAEYNKLKSQIDSTLGSKKAEIEKAQADVKSQTGNKNSPASEAQKSLKESGKKFFKGLKLKK